MRKGGFSHLCLLYAHIHLDWHKPTETLKIVSPYQVLMPLCWLPWWEAKYFWLIRLSVGCHVLAISQEWLEGISSNFGTSACTQGCTCEVCGQRSRSPRQHNARQNTLLANIQCCNSLAEQDWIGDTHPPWNCSDCKNYLCCMVHYPRCLQYIHVQQMYIWI